MNLHIVFGNLLLLLGIFFIITSLIGIKKFKDNLSKLHAVGISDVLGYPLCYVGLIARDFSGANSMKYFLLTIVILITAPLVTHNIAKLIAENSNSAGKKDA